MADRERDDADPDDDSALSWEGDEALGRVTSLTGAGPARTAPAVRQRQEPSGGAPGLGSEPVRPGRPRSLAVTASFGVVYLAWEVLWIVAISRAGSALASGTGGVLGVVASLSQFLALIAAALWFIAVVHLTRDSAARWRIGWLALGLLVTVPWPFLQGLIA